MHFFKISLSTDYLYLPDSQVLVLGKLICHTLSHMELYFMQKLVTGVCWQEKKFISAYLQHMADMDSLFITYITEYVLVLEVLENSVLDMDWDSTHELEFCVICLHEKKSPPFNLKLLL